MTTLMDRGHDLHQTAQGMCQQGITIGQQSRYEEAQHLFLEAIALVLHYPEAYYNLGVALKLRDKPDEAIAAFETALAQQPHYPNALLNLGVIASSTSPRHKQDSTASRRCCDPPTFPKFSTK